MKASSIIAGLALIWSSTSVAQQEAPPSPPTGETTRAWLELQRSNNASWGTPRPMPGEVAERVYARYLKSFEQPIPERFEREGFVGGSKQ